MFRQASDFIDKWYKKKHRKPLIIRGARQVGKSTLIRQFALEHNLNLIEINLEKAPLHLKESFKTLNVKQILNDILILTNRQQLPHMPLLFIDELQAIPEALPALRYFLEEMPTLPIVAAGSLLDFLLSEHEFSMPVGRIEFFHLGPMTFSEFLKAMKEELLLENLNQFSLEHPLSQVVHEKLIRHFFEYLYVGGMPESVARYTEDKNIFEISEIQNNILETYRSDFSKYRKKTPEINLEKVFDYIPRSVGNKMKFSQISQTDRAKDMQNAIDLLTKARVINKIHHSHCGGIPILSGVNEKIYKTLFCDVGLMTRALGLRWQDLNVSDKSKILSLGPLAEQFTGQHLIFRKKGIETPNLHYWIREGKSNNAEVDYVIQEGETFIPIEVKSGKTGSLKSLQQFMYEKRIKKAVKVSLAPFSIQSVKQNLTTGHPISFKLINLPIYAIERVLDFIEH